METGIPAVPSAAGSPHSLPSVSYWLIVVTPARAGKPRCAICIIWCASATKVPRRHACGLAKYAREVGMITVATQGRDAADRLALGHRIPKEPAGMVDPQLADLLGDGRFALEDLLQATHGHSQLSRNGPGAQLRIVDAGADHVPCLLAAQDHGSAVVRLLARHRAQQHLGDAVQVSTQ